MLIDEGGEKEGGRRRRFAFAGKESTVYGIQSIRRNSCTVVYHLPLIRGYDQ